MSDVADNVTGVVLVFAADGGIGVGDYGKGNNLVDVGNDGEIGVTGLDERVTVGHYVSCIV